MNQASEAEHRTEADSTQQTAPDPNSGTCSLQPAAVERSETSSPLRAPKYMVGVLYYGAHDPMHDRCMHAIHQHPYVGEVKELSGCAYIEMGRSLLATILMDSSYDGLLMIDHDMLFEPEEVTRVIDSAERLQGIVGGAYSMRSPGAAMIGAIDTASLPEGERVKFFEGGKVYPATYLGMGFTAIPRAVLEKMAARPDTCGLEGVPNPTPPTRVETGVFKQQIFPFFSLLVEGGKWFGEDISFCIRAHKAGIPIGLDSRIRLHHRGMYDYGLEDCGIIVPFARSLEGIIKENPSVQSSDYSHIPEVAAAYQKKAASHSIVDEDDSPDWPESLPIGQENGLQASGSRLQASGTRTPDPEPLSEVSP